MLRCQVAPPSKVTARNMPLIPSWMLVKTTMFLGLVGLTAIASSDSLPARWLTSMLGGVRGWALATLTEEPISIAIKASARNAYFLLIRLSSGVSIEYE